jgi:hypothetical protein
MMVGVDDVLDGLRGDFLQLRENAVVVDVEFVVDENDAVVGDQRGGIARDEVVVDDVEVVFDFDEVELSGSRRGLCAGEGALARGEVYRAIRVSDRYEMGR